MLRIKIILTLSCLIFAIVTGAYFEGKYVGASQADDETFAAYVEIKHRMAPEWSRVEKHRQVASVWSAVDHE